MKDIKGLVHTALFESSFNVNTYKLQAWPLAACQSHKAPEFPGTGSNCYPNFAGVSLLPSSQSRSSLRLLAIGRHVPAPHGRQEGREGVHAPVAVKGG